MGLLTRMIHGCLRLAARRWPSAVRDELTGEWLAELALIAVGAAFVAAPRASRLRYWAYGLGSALAATTPWLLRVRYLRPVEEPLLPVLGLTALLMVIVVVLPPPGPPADPRRPAPPPLMIKGRNRPLDSKVDGRS